MQLSEQEQIRRNALEELYKLGINAYPPEEYIVNAYADEIKRQFPADNSLFQDVSLAGRIMSRRIMGAASFLELMDSTGRIQLYFKRDDICPGEDNTLYNIVVKRLLDIGDIIGVKGYVFVTKMGEITIHVKGFSILAKSLRPLPIVKEKDGEVYDAFTDPDQRYRQRYVDLIVNDGVRDTFVKRAQVIRSMRDFLNAKNYLEVETPILQAIPGGAAAKPFITHHNALNIPLYLRIANELYLKRLIVGGFDGVFEFAKDFRNEGMSRFHNPEFTQMEIYVAYKDYFWMMEMTQQMVEKITIDLHGTTKVKVDDNIIDFKAPFRRLSILDAIEEITGYDVSNMDAEQLAITCKKLGIETDPSMGKGKLIDEIFGEKCEASFIQPTFITDYPVAMSPLCKRHRNNPELTERFELMVNGKELANAYTELNDPIDQRKRFEEQMELAAQGDDEAMVIDLDFLRAIEYGMPPTSGMGIGIDRLVMLMTNQPSIQEVLFFPQMRPEAIKKTFVTEDFVKLGISSEWAHHLVPSGFVNAEILKKTKPSAIQQKLNGYRKKNNLDIPAIQIEDINNWLAIIN
ncbi:MAG: lysine--tRNA ligase [Bacteroidetes bacterium]|nr:lysine--tRNA ligase [Bacteroidota bacterium]MBL6944709.1 lysine--tRNA ligase [Bacteroidales bacterium]